MTRRIRRTSVARDKMKVSNREFSFSSPISFDPQFLRTFFTNSSTCWILYLVDFLWKPLFVGGFLAFSPSYSRQLRWRKIWFSKSEMVEFYVKLSSLWPEDTCVSGDQLQTTIQSFVRFPTHITRIGASNVFSFVCLAICLETIICIATLSVVVHKSTYRSTSV